MLAVKQGSCCSILYWAEEPEPYIRDAHTFKHPAYGNEKAMHFHFAFGGTTMLRWTEAWKADGVSNFTSPLNECSVCVCVCVCVCLLALSS